MPVLIIIKIFRYNQKYRCGLLPAFRKNFSLSVHVLVAEKSFLHRIIVAVTTTIQAAFQAV